MYFFRKKTFIAVIFFFFILFFGWFFWHAYNVPETLDVLAERSQKAGEAALSDLKSLPALPITEDKDAYTVQDTSSDGIDIRFADEQEKTLAPQDQKDPFTLSFPKDYSQSIRVKLDQERSIEITDLSGSKEYESSILSTNTGQGPSLTEEGVLERLGFKENTQEQKNYLSYTDGRKTLLYAYQKDQGTGEKKLKAWTLYQEGSGLEVESYRISNAKVKLDEQGNANVFYFGDQDLRNQEVQSSVDPSLLERAQRTLQKEMGEDIVNGNKIPDFTIPRPYFIANDGEKTEVQWKWDEGAQTLSLSFSVDTARYPIALDPTLSFVAPGQSNTGSVVAGEITSDNFGAALAAGDFNADGRTDLAVGAYGYSSSTGRVYLFYNDGSIPTTAATADVTITGGATSNYFGAALAAGDFNTDGRTDLAVGAYGYSSTTGRVYLFYNDGSIPTTAATADVTITGETTNNRFGIGIAVGDFNADGRTDLVVGASGYSFNTGRAYLFWNDGSIPTTAATADVTITGGATSNYFGAALAAGDFNADGRTDLAVGAYGYSSSTGRAYLFYNDGSIPTTAATADVTITGGATSNYFGAALAAGDFNADGRTDLAVGAYGYSSNAGRTYLFYNDGSIPTTAATADVTITGEASSLFGYTLASGDFNADGRTDLAVGAYIYSSNAGRAYLFYNDGSIPTTAATADVTITGEASSFFGYAFAVGDFNADGRTDLAVGASGYSSSTGRAYVFYSQNGQANTNQTITGGATSNYFGAALAAGDFNADGRTDLAVGAYGYSSNAGRTYLFYNDGSIPTTAATADVTITGEAFSSFGSSLIAGDFNADGRTDLAVGAYGYSSSTGRAYLFWSDGSIPTTAATADVTITGEASSSFGSSLIAGDFNADGRTDLAVGAYGYSSTTGRAYLFWSDGSIPTTAATADVTITGEASSSFGSSLIAGDFNADGRTDLAVGAYGYSSGTGRAYLFYNDGSIPTTAATADVTITGATAGDYFGISLAAGDFNADGRTDLAVGAYYSYTSASHVYIFYNDGSIPTTASTADVTISGEWAGTYFGNALAAGDWNADGRTDLAVAADSYNGMYSNGGRVYIFYNDDSYPTLAASADVVFTGEATNNYFGYALSAGDFNADGRTDLVIGAYGYSTDTGRVYSYETHENFSWQLQSLTTSAGGLRVGTNGTGEEMKITGEASSSFGTSFAAGDFNADGRTDLVVSAPGYFSNTGRAYLFYGDGSISAAATAADVVITGETSGNYFGTSLIAGDFNADGRTDLAVGAYGYSSNAGRTYLFWSDGSIPTTAATADVTITGEASSSFGSAFAAGDFNADGRTDLAVGAYGYSSNAGRTYLFYNDGSIPTTAATADVTITGEASSLFGYTLASGDFNADGRTDLAVGAYIYSSNAGRAYLFYNDGSIPTTAATADVTITGEASSFFGYAFAVGDFNADGRTDLAVGASGYSSSTGCTYLFWSDGSIPTTAATADVTITGETTNNYFGYALSAGDFNADGRTDLAVGAYSYSSNVGRTYLFWSDGSIPTTAATADVTITGETTNNYFGAAVVAGDFNADGKTDLAIGAYTYSSSTGRTYLYTFNDPVITGETSSAFGYAMTAGDFNADGRTDLVVSASEYSSGVGRAYIFYSDGSIPTTATTADVTITGEIAEDYFGISLAAGDFNADGRTDLAVGAYGYSAVTGRAYLFWGDGSIPTTAATADVTITGEASSLFGHTLAAGDFNADGRTDLVVGATGYSSSTGRAYLFYNDGSIPTTAATADVTITGGTTNNYFGISLAAGDFNADGRTDLAVGAYGYSAATGRAYLFYNDGSIPTTAATADVTITGEASSLFGHTLAAGDFNADGKTDLAVGAYVYSSNAGRAYIFYNDGSIPTTAATADVTITGEASSSFGSAFAAGDFNADGRTDLAVGAYGYSSSTGCTYLFWSDGSIPTTAATADVTITGETTNNYFGYALSAGDFNADGRTDLAVGAYGYSSTTGRAYIFTTEAKVDVVPVMTRVRGTAKFLGDVKFK